MTAPAPAKLEIPGYQVLRLVATGGMSYVYMAMQRSLERLVALKVMRAYNGDSREESDRYSKRFLLEGRTLARLPHRNIVAVFDIVAESTLTYIALEYLEGGTLAERMQKGLSLAEAVAVIVQIASALEFAHSHGIVHRDLKPANIMFRDNTTPVLTDFGIARSQDAQSMRLTQTGMLVGTPTYMSPEQINGLDVDGRSDLYSLGILFYELLCGEPPLKGDTPVSVLMAHLTQAPAPLPEAFAPLQPIVDRLLAKKRDDRCANMREFVFALKDALTGSSTLWLRLQSDPNQTLSEQLHALGFSHTTADSHSLASLSKAAAAPAAGAATTRAPTPVVPDVDTNRRLSKPEPAESAATSPAENFVNELNARRPRSGKRAAVLPQAAVQPSAPPATRKEDVEGARKPWLAVIVVVAILGLSAIGTWYFLHRGAATTNELVTLMLKQADLLIEQGQLSAPPADNAYDVLRKVLEKSPNNPLALERQAIVAKKLGEQAERLLGEDNRALARSRIDLALSIAPYEPNLRALSQKISAPPSTPAVPTMTEPAPATAAGNPATTAAATTTTPAATPVTDVAPAAATDAPDQLALAREALQKKRYLSPKSTNAKSLLEAMVQAEPDNVEAKALLDGLPQKIADEIGERIRRNDLPAAQSLLDQARGAYPNESNWRGPTQSLTQARAAAERQQRIDRVGRGLAAPVSAGGLRSALTDIVALDSADADAVSWRQRWIETLAQALRGAKDLAEFDELAALLGEAQSPLAAQPALAALAREAPALRTKLMPAPIADELIVVMPEDLGKLWKTDNAEQPVQPSRAVAGREDGCVAVGLVIENNGGVSGPRVLRSVPKGRFDRFAMDAARKWHFVPTAANGKHQPVYTYVLFSFRFGQGNDAQDAAERLTAQCKIKSLVK